VRVVGETGTWAATGKSIRKKGSETEAYNQRKFSKKKAALLIGNRPPLIQHSQTGRLEKEGSEKEREAVKEGAWNIPQHKREKEDLQGRKGTKKKGGES